LIRTSHNWIAGPYPKEQIRTMITEGQLTLQDEVCAANSYWVYVHEREEIHQLLGVAVPRQAGEGEEITETQMKYVEEDEVTDPDLGYERAESTTETTAVISTDSLKEFRKPKIVKKKSSSVTPVIKKAESAIRKKKGSIGVSAGASVAVQKIEIKGKNDPASLWRGLAWALIVAAGLLVVALFRLYGK